jgi:hypothetical protein
MAVIAARLLVDPKSAVKMTAHTVECYALGSNAAKAIADRGQFVAEPGRSDGA